MFFQIETVSLIGENLLQDVFNTSFSDAENDVTEGQNDNLT